MIIFALNAIPHSSFIINRKIKPTTSYLSWHIQWNHITQDKFSSMQDDIYVNSKTGFKLFSLPLALFLSFFLFPLLSILFARSFPESKYATVHSTYHMRLVVSTIRACVCVLCSSNNCYSLCFTLASSLRWSAPIVVTIIINLSHHHWALSLMRPLDHNRKCTKKTFTLSITMKRPTEMHLMDFLLLNVSGDFCAFESRKKL